MPKPDRYCTASSAKDAEDFNSKNGNEPGLQADAFEKQITDEMQLPEEQQNTPVSTTHKVPGYNGISKAAFISNKVVEKRTSQGKERSSSIAYKRSRDDVRSQSQPICTVLNTKFENANSFKIRAN